MTPSWPKLLSARYLPYPNRDMECTNYVSNGDLKAKVSSDNRNREASIGNHGEGLIIENGEMFCDFCASKMSL